MSKWVQNPAGYCPIVAFQHHVDWFEYNANMCYHRALNASLSTDIEHFQYLYVEYSTRAAYAKWHMKRHHEYQR